MSTYRFFALVDRLRWIKRWGLKRNVTDENVMEHSWQVATIAHSLAIIKFYVFNKASAEYTPETVATAALYHDCSEVITGDLPTPIKYHSKTITDAYKRIEDEAEQELTDQLPDLLKQHLSSYLLHRNVHPEVAALVKQADMISAYLKCQAEVGAGNPEFTQAQRDIEQAIRALNSPEVDYFMAKFVSSYQLSLDELIKQHEPS